MEWTKYTTKEALKDNDELMILDTDGKANKRTLMDKVWDYVVDKMTTAVIAKLETTNKTLIGAVNELNSKIVTGTLTDSDNIILFEGYKNCLIFLSHPYFGCGLYAITTFDGTGLAETTIIKQASGITEITRDGKNLIIRSEKNYSYSIFVNNFYN